MNSNNSNVWVVFAVFLIIIGYLTFGDHGDFDSRLQDIGFRTTVQDQYSVHYGPNVGGFLVYAIGAGIIAGVVSSRK